jgi:hypothetical protein
VGDDFGTDFLFNKNSWLYQYEGGKALNFRKKCKNHRMMKTNFPATKQGEKLRGGWHIGAIHPYQTIQKWGHELKYQAT